MLENGTLLSGGGVDGKLSAWDANKYFNTPLQEAQVKLIIKKIYSQVLLIS